MTKLLALDQSSRINGWAIFEDNKLISYGKFSLEDEEIEKRLIQLSKFICRVVKEKKIDEIALEDIQMQTSVGNNVKTFKVLAQVQGVVLFTAEMLGIPHTVVSAAAWKSTLGIKGKNRPEQKKNAQLYVEEHYHIKPTQDECDAICIGVHVSSKMVAAHKITNNGFDWSE